MSTDPEGANALDIDQAVAKLASRRAEAAAKPAEATEDPPEPADEVDAPEDDAQDAVAQDEIEDDGEPSVEEEPAIEVELPDGKRKLTAAEIRDGVMLKADYTRKTMAAAEERKAAEAEKAEATRLREQLSEALQTWAVPTEVEPDWDALAAKDPVLAFREKAKWDKRQAKAREAAEAYRMLQEHERVQTVQAEYAKLVQAVPEWQNPETLKKAFEGMTDAAKGYGFSPEEILNITDHRILRVLKDVSAYHRLQAAKPAVEKKVAAAAPKTLNTGAKPPRDADVVAEIRQSKAKLKASGSVDDAIALLRARRISKG